MISPGAIVSDVHPLLGARAGGDQGAIGVEDRLVKVRRGLFAPDLDPGLIEDILEGLDVVGGEAAAEVARGGGVGDAVGAEGVEEDNVVASQLDVVETGAVAQGVVGEVEDVVGLVVGEVEFEQMESFVDRLGQPEFPDQKVNGTDPAARDRAGLGGAFVMDVRGGEDRLGRRCGDRAVEPQADFALAGGVVSVWNRLHSKSPCGLGHGIGVGQSNVPETPGDFEFFTHQQHDLRLRPRLVKG